MSRSPSSAPRYRRRAAGSSEGRIGARIGGPGKRARGSRPVARLSLFALAALGAVLVIAWIDGGEEPIRPIIQQVSFAEGAQ